jgi:stage II sporulation protein D
MRIPFLFFSLTILTFLATGCSGSKESYDRKNDTEFNNENIIRVLLDEKGNDFNWVVQSPVYLKDGENNLALINPGNKVVFSSSNGAVEINIESKNFESKYFQLTATETGSPVEFNGNFYKGSLKFISDANGIKVINVLSVEQYLKGVIPREMPSGNGTEYYEALKAFAICARTYTISKINESKNVFDVFADTRDQVYGGSGVEKSIINQVVDETRGLILTYDGKPAMAFYHSTCGGFTEDAENVFPNIDVPYLKSVRDGDPSYCSISPKFTWTEKYDEREFINRFVSSGYLNNPDYTLANINVNSRFESGRINELEIDLLDRIKNPKSIKLYGNKIRYVIRTSDNKSILESSNFEIKVESDRKVVVKGKGYGHGVGLCQWGALAQSQQGRSYKEILSFYYPGTKIEK